MVKKVCNICKTRPIDKEASVQDACLLCATEGEWENTHTDGSHEKLAQLVDQIDIFTAVELRKAASSAGVKNAAKYKSAQLRELFAKAIADERKGCWICYPELNEAQRTTKARVTGERFSRKGQVIHVPLRAPGEEKAAVIVKAAPGAPIQIFTEKQGTVRLDLTTPSFVLILAWDAKGRYDYDRSVAAVGGKQKKVRNVSEALRILATVGNPLWS